MKNKKLLKIAILSLFFVKMGIGTITPAIATIAAFFNDVPFTTLLLVSTLPSLISVPATLVSGRLAGDKVPYKTLLLIGMVLFIGGGMAPYFLTNFSAILAVRVIFGIGLGMVMPLGTALIICFFDGDERAKMLGFGNVAANIGGILFQLLGGLLAGISWQYCFLAHIIAVVTLLLIFTLPEPEKAPAPANGNSEKIKIPLSVYGYSLFVVALMMLYYPLLIKMSTIVATYELGTPADAAMVLTMFTVGGMGAGMIFGKVFQIFKKNTLSIGIGLLAAAMFSIGVGTNLTFMYLGATIGGIGFSFIIPTIMMDLGKNLAPQLISTASAMVMASINIGGFLSAYFYALISPLFGQADSLKFPFFFAGIAFVVFAVGFIFAALKPSSNKEHSVTEES